MAVECALCLIDERNLIEKGDIEKGFPKIEGGIFTPSVVFCNTNIIQRLTKAGIVFKILEENKK